MRIALPASLSLAAAGLLLLSLPAAATTKPRHPARSTHAAVRNTSTTTHATTHHLPAVAGMAPERATEIQTALIQHGYLTGQPSGQWDSQTAAAMQKLQGDNGWQTKITPDSRALIKLGLGPQTATPATPDATLSGPTSIQ
jgi:hypothetical protein